MNVNNIIKNEANRIHRLQAAVVDIGLSSAVSLTILQLLRQAGFNGSIIWFLVICFFAFELRDVIGKRSIGKRIFGLCIMCSAREDSSVSTICLLLRNSIDFFFPLALFQIYKYNEKKGDKITKTKVCSIPDDSVMNKSNMMNNTSKRIIVIATLVLFCISFHHAGFSYLKETAAYTIAIEHLRSSAYCEKYELKAGSVLGHKAGFYFLADKDNCVITLEYINNEWKVIYCEYYEIE